MTIPEPAALTDNQYRPQHEPAHVRYLSGNRAIVTHALGPRHPNAVATVVRLTRKGFTVTTDDSPYRTSVANTPTPTEK